MENKNEKDIIGINTFKELLRDNNKNNEKTGLTYSTPNNNFMSKGIQSSNLDKILSQDESNEELEGSYDNSWIEQKSKEE